MPSSRDSFRRNRVAPVGSIRLTSGAAHRQIGPILKCARTVAFHFSSSIGLPHAAAIRFAIFLGRMNVYELNLKYPPSFP